MKEITLKNIGLMICVTHFTGCAFLNNEISLAGDDRATLASANQFLNKDFEDIDNNDLLNILDPNKHYLNKKVTGIYVHDQNMEATSYSCSLDNLLTPEEQEKQTDSEKISKAFKAANSCYSGKAHRNQIQDRFLAASIQRCNFYQTYLKDISIHHNGIFGSATTFLGGAGAIVTGESAARVLSGLAGITSGIRAETNQAIFESIATSIIIPAINIKRDEKYKEILLKRNKGIAEYTVQAALADAILFHRDCRIDAGISYAEQSIGRYDDIGLKKLRETLNDAGLGRSFSRSLFSNTDENKSYLIANNELTKYKQPLIEMQNQIKSAKKPPQVDLDQLIVKYNEGGDYFKKALEFDNNLKDIIFEYHQSAGFVKESNQSKINDQQDRVIKFFSALENERIAMKQKVTDYINAK